MNADILSCIQTGFAQNLNDFGYIMLGFVKTFTVSDCGSTANCSHKTLKKQWQQNVGNEKKKLDNFKEI